ncbi:MAG: hypothetical protein FWG00_03430 [Coriobacteriia bacterium]|nr:hypothetical protein [Coriobacteriia bacterium]
MNKRTSNYRKASASNRQRVPHAERKPITSRQLDISEASKSAELAVDETIDEKTNADIVVDVDADASAYSRTSTRYHARNTDDDDGDGDGDTSDGDTSDVAADNDDVADNSTAADNSTTADNNAGSTMSYAAVGESVPELPFAFEEENEIEKNADKDNKQVLDTDSKKPAGTSTRDSRRISIREIEQDDLERSARQASGRNKERSGRARAIQQSAQDSQKPRTGTARRDSTKTSALGTFSASAKTASSKKTGFQNYTKGTSKPDAYTPLTENSGNYHIRGGGKLQLKSPAFIIVYGLILVAALALVAVALNGILTTLSNGADRNPITLTQAETRAAIDENMPILVNNLDKKVSDAVKSLSGDGRTIFQDERYTPDSIDPTAKGQGIIFMPQSVTDEFMEGFFEGSYVPYTPGELQEFFNGSWSLEMARGDLGAQHKLRYINLNAASVKDEMKTLADFQELSGEGITIAAEGTDPRGNFVMQGTKAVGERIYYWKIAACSFNEIYRGRSIPNNAAYVSCTVSDFDFYTGSDEIK